MGGDKELQEITDYLKSIKAPMEEMLKTVTKVQPISTRKGNILGEEVVITLHSSKSIIIEFNSQEASKKTYDSLTNG